MNNQQRISESLRIHTRKSLPSVGTRQIISMNLIKKCSNVSFVFAVVFVLLFLLLLLLLLLCFVLSFPSSSSCRATSTDIPDPLLPLLPIVHCSWQVLRATSRIFTELLYVASSWSPCFWLGCEGIHRRTSLMSSSPLLQQCPARLVRITLIVFVMGGGRIAAVLWDVASRTCSKLLAAFSCSLPSSYFSIRFVIVHVVHTYSSIDTTAAFHFIGQV